MTNFIHYLPVPTPNVTVSLSSESNQILAGSSLNITCTITLDSRVDTPVIVTPTWSLVRTKTEITTNSRIMIHNLPLTDSWLYQSVLTFNELSEEDSGTYQCTVSIRSTTDYPYVLPADNVSKNVFINVQSKEHCIHVLLMLVYYRDNYQDLECDRIITRY